MTLLLNDLEGQPGAQPIIAIPSDEMDEFFAFTSTYIATHKPYSAFYHVIPLEMASAVEGRQPLEVTRVASVARLVAGAARAEAFLASRSGSGFTFRSGLASANAMRPLHSASHHRAIAQPPCPGLPHNGHRYTWEPSARQTCQTRQVRFYRYGNLCPRQSEARGTKLASMLPGHLSRYRTSSSMGWEVNDQ